MSDYTSTFTEGTGDTIDAADFSTEFDAIETASATKLDKAATTGDLTLSGTTVYPLIHETASATTSGSSVDYTGLPSWVKKITVMANKVRKNATGDVLIRLGDAGGFESTGYVASTAKHEAAANNNQTSTAEFFIVDDIIAAVTISGSCTFTNLDGNIWVQSGAFVDSQGFVHSCSGWKELSDTLTQIRIFTAATFDSGSVNIIYEG